jgi:2-polyprenyl-3-methyl-5-hydroxy-6-metoxy-1,4-benzoquinol methylase
MGFRVSGCDLSLRAIERARFEASRRNVDIHFSVENMLNLTSLGESHFDAVICMDNALPHLESAEQIFQAASYNELARAEYSLTEGALSPLQTEPTQLRSVITSKIRATTLRKNAVSYVPHFPGESTLYRFTICFQ